MFKNYKIFFFFLIIINCISCSYETEKQNKDDEVINEIIIEKEDISDQNEVLDDEDYSYVDWWPVKSESSDNEYKTSTSTIEIKKIPFPKQFNENED
tara:strand:+ start:9813 stop:10103 length:291 start_codon:yes stop_codon:yes gene_type:complete